jgi:hypothetical protein
MTVGFPASLRNARLDEITTAAGASALLRIYDGTRPATGGTATVTTNQGRQDDRSFTVVVASR